VIDQQCELSRHPGPDGAVWIRIAGEIDMDVRACVQRAIEEVVADPGTDAVRVDLDAVTFLGASGISALLAARRAAVGLAVSYRVVNPRPQVRRVLEIADVLAMLTEDTRAD